MAKKSEAIGKLSSEWHPIRNVGLKFENIPATSNLMVWWRCSKISKHEWQTRFRNRAIDGNGCPFCTRLRTLPEDSFPALHPKIFAEWHPTRNVGIDPWKIAPKSSKRVWWQCKSIHKHEWQATISTRVINGSGCKQCNRIRNPLSESAPEIAKEWHPTKNHPLTPDGISSGSKQRVWWRCLKDLKHEWQASVGTRVKAKTGCRYCARLSPQRKFQPLDIVSPKLASQWHPTKNEGRLPSQFSPNSHHKVWWVCPNDPSHVWLAVIKNRFKFNQGCPQCAPRSTRLSPSRSLAARFPEIAKEWHPTKNILKPSEVMAGSSKRVWWQCKVNPDHEWQATVTVRTQRKSGGKCPHCSGYYVGSSNSLQAKYPDIAKEWHPTKNAPLTPDKIKKASGQRVWWRCSTNPTHEWQTRVKNRTILGNGCPYCALFHSAKSNTDYYGTFQKDIRSLRSLLKYKRLRKPTLRQAFFRMLYSSTITTLETYLLDAFFHRVIKSKVLVERLIQTTPEFKDKKYSISELFEWKDHLIEKVTDYLLSIVWHNIAKVRCIYNDVLNLKFPEECGPVFAAIQVRHDIVHRSGRTKRGKPHNFTESDIEKLFGTIENFVNEIDRQLKKQDAARNGSGAAP